MKTKVIITLRVNAAQVSDWREFRSAVMDAVEKAVPTCEVTDLCVEEEDSGDELGK